MQGQAIFYSMPKTLCNSQGACTILAAQVGVVFADGKDANPSSGIIALVLARENKYS